MNTIIDCIHGGGEQLYIGIQIVFLFWGGKKQAESWYRLIIIGKYLRVDIYNHGSHIDHRLSQLKSCGGCKVLHVPYSKNNKTD